MKKWCFVLALILFILHTTQSTARRTYFTPEQKAQLEQAQIVFLNVLALTEKGRADASSLFGVAKRRMEEVGYTVVVDRSQPSDVEFKIKCEERKTWVGTTSSGGDAELPDAPARLWKGPACLLSYKVGGKDLGWHKEVRTNFENALQAAKVANVKDSGTYALNKLTTRLEEYDFPLTLSAEWGQVNRLLQLLDSPNTPKLRKLRIISILSDLQSDEALPHLTKVMQDKDLAQEAIVALGGVGRDSIPLLIDLFQQSQHDAIRIAAAKGLGQVAAATGDPRTIPPLVGYLNESLKTFNRPEDINYPVLTEVVWSIGKLLDDISREPMAELMERVWLIYDTSEEMQKLREATNWTYKQTADETR